MMNVATVYRDGDDYGPLEIQHAADYLFAYLVNQGDELPTLSSGTVTIRKGSTIYVDQEPLAVNANRFEFSFLATAQPADPTEAIIAEFFLKPLDAAIEDFTYRTVFDAVLVPLRVPIIEADLFRRYPQLRDSRRLGFEEGEADPTSSAASLVAVQLQAYEDGFYTGGEVEIIEGPAAGEWRNVVSFDGALGQAVVEPDFSTSLTEDSQFRIRRSWTPIISEAWASIRKAIRDRGNRPALIMDGQAFREPVLRIAASMAFMTLGKISGEEDRNNELALALDKRGWASLDGTLFLYDSRDSGDPDTTIRQQVTYIRRR